MISWKPSCCFTRSSNHIDTLLIDNQEYCVHAGGSDKRDDEEDNDDYDDELTVYQFSM